MYFGLADIKCTMSKVDMGGGVYTLRVTKLLINGVEVPVTGLVSVKITESPEDISSVILGFNSDNVVLELGE